MLWEIVGILAFPEKLYCSISRNKAVKLFILQGKLQSEPQEMIISRGSLFRSPVHSRIMRR
ncbi:MAG TPA: hypothetical protein DC053_22095 [Lachnoclostridium sp.]|nr:hypothetical protein [Lachnoclostridium sp.]